MTEAFEKLVSLLDYPMFVVTTRAGDEPAGCLVGFATQVSDYRNPTTPTG
jgi:flavin reductase (DIM6/NTAB) family NADH-FMN oxidoreductase RutF